MSQNIQQIFVANPASSMVSTDLLYLGRSPYGPTDDFAITFANFVASIGTATPTASTIPRWDAYVNMSANNFLANYATTATAAATTTLTVSSAYNQYFTGTTTQTVVLPVTSTLVLGFPFRIVNNSTGVVTVQSSGTNTIQAMAPGSSLLLTCIAITGTTAASWDAQYIIAADVSGAVLLSPSGAQTITGFGLTAPSIAFSTTSGIIGTTTNDSAASGSVGEYVNSNVPLSPGTNIASNTATNLTSINLTAGDWDVSGNLSYHGSSAISIIAWATIINTASATLPGDGSNYVVNSGTSTGLAGGTCITTRVSIASTTPVYLIGYVTLSGVTTCVMGGNISARRVR